MSYRERLRRRSCDRRSPGVGRATCTHASSGRIERAVLTCRGAYAMHNLSSMRHEIWAARAPGSKTVRAHVKGGGQQPKSRQFGLLFSVQNGHLVSKSALPRMSSHSLRERPSVYAHLVSRVSRCDQSRCRHDHYYLLQALCCGGLHLLYRRETSARLSALRLFFFFL